MTRHPGAMLNVRRSTASRLLTPGTLVVAFTTFAALLTSSASADVIGSVILQDYRGAVATPDGVQEPKPIRFQDQVSALDTVQTGDGGATSMQFLDETRFDVGPNAMVKLDDFVFDPASTEGAGRISMAVGAFRFVGGKMKSDENVKLVTPTATMTIRGTELVIYVGLDGTTEVNVVDGSIDVQVCDKAEVVPAAVGQRVVIPPTCSASVTVARPVPTDLAGLDVPDDLGDFATAAGGDEGGPGDDGGPGGDDRGGRKNDRDQSEPDPEPAAPDPGPAPEPDPDEGGEEGNPSY